MTVRRTTKRRVSVRERILNAITAAGRPLSVTAIADELGKPPESGWVQRGFGALIREGVIKVAGDGFVLAT